MSKVYLSLGSNIGDKFAYINQAIELLNKHQEVDVVRQSSYYETSPVGYLDQDNFINVALEVNTSLEPYALLSLCQEIEKKLKRERTIRFGPRTIDIDILLYDNVVMNDEKLTIPHPRMTERAFVLVPLSELNSNLNINGYGILYLLEKVKNNNESIKKIPNY
ncbi:MAG TPA: 2-amino-4-hydroxy-6-hydroxymethyldihydropteridine diphosphokinase [Haloplasmataceae bacterium]